MSSTLIKSNSKFTMRSREKFGDPYAKAISKETATEPGPGQYKLEGKFLIGSESQKYSFPKSPAPALKPAMAPGPGAYPAPGAIGRQIVSTKITAEKTCFTLAARSSLASTEFDVGPGGYGAPSAACEEQYDSRKKTCPSLKFGTGYKKGNQKSLKVDLTEPVPGPGAYVIPGGLGKESVIFRNPPKASLSGRNSFMSPW